MRGWEGVTDPVNKNQPTSVLLSGASCTGTKLGRFRREHGGEKAGGRCGSGWGAPHDAPKWCQNGTRLANWPQLRNGATRKTISAFAGSEFGGGGIRLA